MRTVPFSNGELPNVLGGSESNSRCTCERGSLLVLRSAGVDCYLFAGTPWSRSLGQTQAFDG
jgi:hypothetical protein